MKCDTPYYVLPKAGIEKVPVPCGKCPNCKRNRVNHWVFRLMKQSEIEEHAHFVTLTYDTRYVPISPNGYMTLRKKDVQDYMKRLRKLEPGQLKYYFVGEYGSKNKRPHYHAIVFGVSDSENFFRAWHIGDNPLGQVHVGTVSNDSVAYTMKYIDKPAFERKHARDDRAREFSLMSKKMGVNYITDQIRAYHNADVTRNYVTLKGGVRVSMPRYYREKIYDEQQRKKQIAIMKDHEPVELEKLRRMWQKYYPDGRLDFYDWLESIKYQRYHSFYSQINKNRDV